MLFRSYPTRALLLPEGSRTQAVAMGFVGSIVQTMVIAACGFVSLFFFVQNTDSSGIDYTKIFISIVLILLLAVVFVSKIHTVGVFMQKSRFGFVRKIGNGLYYTTVSQLAKLITVSLLKYLAFSTQFLLIHIRDGRRRGGAGPGKFFDGPLDVLGSAGRDRSAR